MKEMHPALVLGCHKIGLGIIRSLGEKRVPVVGMSYSTMDMGYASKYVVEHHQCPHPDNDPEGFVSRLKDLGDRWSQSVLIPSDDATLIAVSKNKELLGSFFKVAAGDWPVVEQCIIKKHTYDLAERIGVPCPRSRILSSIEEAKAFVREIGLPCLLKPTVGHSFFERFRQKMFFARNLNELENLCMQFTDAGIEVMIQEFIPGNDRCGANFNSFIIKGEPMIAVTAEKVRLSPPQIGFPRVVVSKRLPELLEPANTFLRALGYEGFSCLEFKKDARDGIYRLMEINARLNLSTPLSVMAGVNFPYLLYRHTLQGEIPQPLNGFREGIYWIDPGKDIAESIRSYGKERFSIMEYMKPYIKPHTLTIFSITDMGPFFKRCYDLAIKGGRRMANKLFKRNSS
jgi:D-aspartate ligase